MNVWGRGFLAAFLFFLITAFLFYLTPGHQPIGPWMMALALVSGIGFIFSGDSKC